MFDFDFIVHPFRRRFPGFIQVFWKEFFHGFLNENTARSTISLDVSPRLKAHPILQG